MQRPQDEKMLGITEGVKESGRLHHNEMPGE